MGATVSSSGDVEALPSSAKCGVPGEPSSGQADQPPPRAAGSGSASGCGGTTGGAAAAASHASNSHCGDNNDDDDDDDHDSVAAALGRAVRGFFRPSSAKARVVGLGLPARLPSRTIARGADRLAQVIDLHDASSTAAEGTQRHRLRGWRVRALKAAPVFANELAKSTVLGTVLFDSFEAARDAAPSAFAGLTMRAPHDTAAAGGTSDDHATGGGGGGNGGVAPAAGAVATPGAGLLPSFVTDTDVAFVAGMLSGGLHGTLSVAWDSAAASARILRGRARAGLRGRAGWAAEAAAAAAAVAARSGPRPSLHGTVLSHMLVHATLFGTFTGLMRAVRATGLDSDNTITGGDVLREVREMAVTASETAAAAAAGRGRRAAERGGDAARAQPAGSGIGEQGQPGQCVEAGQQQQQQQQQHQQCPLQRPQQQQQQQQQPQTQEKEWAGEQKGEDVDVEGDNEDDDDDDDGHAAMELVAAVAVAGAVAGVASEVVGVATAPWEVHRPPRPVASHPVTHKLHLVVRALKAPGSIRGVLLSGVISGALGFLAYEFADL